MVLDTFLFNSQQYKVRIKDIVEQSRERDITLSVVAIENGAFCSPSTTIANFTYLFFEQAVFERVSKRGKVLLEMHVQRKEQNLSWFPVSRT